MKQKKIYASLYHSTVLKCFKSTFLFNLKTNILKKEIEMKTQTYKNKALAIVAILMCTLLAASLFGCSSSSNTSDSSSSSTKTKLIVGFDQSYPPYGFLADDGSFTGFDLDLAKKVCEKQGWDIELQAIDWDAKDALL